MLRARLTRNDGTQILLIGLSEESIAALRDGKPMMFDGSQYGVDMNICLMYGVTEIALAKQLGLPIPQ